MWAGPCVSPEALGKSPLRPPAGRWKPPVSSRRRAEFPGSRWLAAGVSQIPEAPASPGSSAAFQPAAAGPVRLALQIFLPWLRRLPLLPPAAPAFGSQVKTTLRFSGLLWLDGAPLERSRKAPLCQGPCASLEPRSPFAAECAHAHVPDIRSRTRLSCPPPTTRGDGSTWLSDSSFEPETSGMKIFPKCEIFQTRILKRCESRGKCTSKANDLSLASFSPTEVKNYSSAACVGVVAVPRRVWTVPLALFAQCRRFTRLLTRGSTTTATSRPRDRLVHIDWCGNKLLSFSWVS